MCCCNFRFTIGFNSGFKVRAMLSSRRAGRIISMPPSSPGGTWDPHMFMKIFRRRVSGCMIAALLSAHTLFAAPSPARPFDRGRIHADYQAGDFEKVIAVLEKFSDTGRRCSREDSVFLEKHLAVVYAADPKTRELGRYHMFRMLSLEPASDMLDMFVGEEVDRIFEKVRKEFAVARAGAGPAAANRAAANPTSVTAPAAATAPVASKPRPARRAKAAALPLSAFPARYPAPRLKPWNLEDVPRTASLAPVAALPPAPPSGPAKPAILASPPSPRQAAPVVTGTRNLTPIPPVEPISLRPRWREPGFWVGSGAAVAVLGLAVYFAGSSQWDEPASRTRTYAVPAKPSN